MYRVSLLRFKKVASSFWTSPFPDKPTEASRVIRRTTKVRLHVAIVSQLHLLPPKGFPLGLPQACWTTQYLAEPIEASGVIRKTTTFRGCRLHVAIVPQINPLPLKDFPVGLPQACWTAPYLAKPIKASQVIRKQQLRSYRSQQTILPTLDFLQLKEIPVELLHVS